MEFLASVQSVLGNQDFKTDNTNETHHWLADEPLEIGGKFLGPNPYELLLSALSSCSAITMKMYANRKEWPMEGAEIECDLVKANPDAPYSIRRRIRVLGPLTEDQTERLIQIANLCPVHKMLNQNTVIETIQVF